MLIDTHCHLNFKRFKKNVNEVIDAAVRSGIGYMIAPGTDVPTSEKAVHLAKQNEHVFAAVGIHPHHVFEMMIKEPLTINSFPGLEKIEALLDESRVLAIGEVGMDKHMYKETKYEQYAIDERFIHMQGEVFRKQVELARRYRKSLIIHNREAKHKVTGIMRELWDGFFENRSVFHCCEPDPELLSFAKEHKMFIGVDGDITYWKEKQEFIRSVPLDMLVLETDSPYLLPEPLRTQKLFPNEPRHIRLVLQMVATLKGEREVDVEQQTTENARQLFHLPFEK